MASNLNRADLAIGAPLRILGMTDLCVGHKPHGGATDYLGLVRCLADSLLSTINDILDFSKIEAGKMEVKAEAFDLCECAEETAKQLGRCLYLAVICRNTRSKLPPMILRMRVSE